MNEFQKFLVSLNGIIETIDRSMEKSMTDTQKFALETMRSTIKMIIIAAEGAIKKENHHERTHYRA